MDDLTPYPWQYHQWQILHEQRRRNLLPHAMLFYGQPGLGLDHFAHCFVQSLVCRSVDDNGFACGQCPACRQFAQGVYPDYQQVTIAEDKSAILVDQIRELNEFIGLTQGTSGRKVVLLSPADRMNINAANSFLKTLEEPSGDTMIVLVAHSLSRLPATIKSRCQLLKFSKPDKVMARQWLEQRGCTEVDHLLHLSSGAPCLAETLNDKALLDAYSNSIAALLEALESRQTMPELRRVTSAAEISRLVLWIQSLLRDLQRAFHGMPDVYFENSFHIQQLRRLSGLLDFRSVFEAGDRFLKLGATIDHPLNADLLLDDVLQTWMTLTANTTGK